jgi:hypothetical protein
MKSTRTRKLRTQQFRSYDQIPQIKYGHAILTDSQRKASAIIAKRALVAAYNEENEPNICIIDLLADLRHICDAAGLDFGALDHDAYQHYCAELFET